MQHRVSRHVDVQGDGSVLVIGLGNDSDGRTLLRGIDANSLNGSFIAATLCRSVRDLGLVPTVHNDRSIERRNIYGRGTANGKALALLFRNSRPGSHARIALRSASFGTPHSDV